MFDLVQFDICGVCNAKCTWCVSGRKNRYGNKLECREGNKKSPFIDIEEFKRAVYYIKENGFLKENATFNLYMWGDPYLHPDFNEILKFMHSENIPTVLSTNASIPRLVEEKGIMSNVEQIWFSMPGFSQESYDRCHGFDFEKIKQNIRMMAKNYYEVGGLRPGAIRNIFHMYQYNLLELPYANEFAQEVGATFWPYTAYFNDYDLMRKYFDHTLDRDILEKASKELFLSGYDKKGVGTYWPNHHCQQYNQLSIDEQCNCVICCGYSNVKLGKIFDLKPEDINEMRLNSSQCKECKQKGLDHIDVMQINEVMPIWGVENSTRTKDALKDAVNDVLVLADKLIRIVEK